jgi:hypothetical protein
MAARGHEFDYKKSQLETWDFVVLAVYFVTVLIVGIWVRFRHSPEAGS